MGSQGQGFSALHWYFQTKNGREPWKGLSALTGEGLPPAGAYAQLNAEALKSPVQAQAPIGTVDSHHATSAEDLDELCKWIRSNKPERSQQWPETSRGELPAGEAEKLWHQNLWKSATAGEPLNSRHYIATVLNGSAPPITTKQRRQDVITAYKSTFPALSDADGTAPLPRRKRTARLCTCGGPKHDPQSDNVKGVFEQLIERGPDPDRPEKETMIQLWRHDVMVSCVLASAQAGEDSDSASNYRPDISRLDLQPSQDSLTRCWQGIHETVDGTYHELFSKERGFMIGEAAKFMECMMNALQCGERLDAHSQIFFQARVWERFRRFASMMVHKKMVGEVPNYVWMGTAPTMTEPPHYAVYRPLEGLCREWLEETGHEKRFVRFEFEGRGRNADVEKWLKRKAIDVRAVLQAERCAAKYTLKA